MGETKEAEVHGGGRNGRGRGGGENGRGRGRVCDVLLLRKYIPRIFQYKSKDPVIQTG